MELSVIDELTRTYNFDKQKFWASIEEEFLVFHGFRRGEIDVPYLCRQERVSHTKVRKTIQETFGKQVFNKDIRTKNEVTKEEFLEHYQFGIYPNVREWIGHLYKATNKVLTRETLFTYLTEDNVNKRWETLPNESFV